MKIKTLVNGSILFVGLALAVYSQLKSFRLRFNVESVAVEEEQQPQQKFERWQLKPGSIYDGDTLTVQRRKY